MQAIYSIKNTINGMSYVGSTKNLQKRFREHVIALQKNSHHNQHLQNAWDKYGEKSFCFMLIEEVKEMSLLLEREQYWLDKTEVYKRDKGYNICSKAISCEGVTRSDQFKNNLSKKRRGPLNPNFGKKPTTETRKRMSESHKGKKNHMYGKKHTPETRKKMSEAVRRKGHVQTEEHVRKRIANSTKKHREKSKLTPEIVKEIRRLREEEGTKMRVLGETFGISERHVHKIVHYTIWKDI